MLHDITGLWAEFGYSEYLIVSFWYASAACQAFISPWVFWLDCISPKYNCGSTKLTWYAAKAYQKGKIGYKYCWHNSFELKLENLVSWWMEAADVRLLSTMLQSQNPIQFCTLLCTIEAACSPASFLYALTPLSDYLIRNQASNSTQITTLIKLGN